MEEAQVAPTHKTCTKCAKLKSLDQFYKNPRGKYGYDAWCISCKKGRNHRLLIQRKGYKSPQTLARRAVNNALKKGIIKKPLKCVRCGVEANDLSGHHVSYAEKDYLKVRWLCRVCHDIEDHPTSGMGTFYLAVSGTHSRPQFDGTDGDDEDDEALSVPGEGDDLSDGEDGSTSG